MNKNYCICDACGWTGYSILADKHCPICANDDIIREEHSRLKRRGEKKMKKVKLKTWAQIKLDLGEGRYTNFFCMRFDGVDAGLSMRMIKKLGEEIELSEDNQDNDGLFWDEKFFNKITGGN